VRSQVCSCWGFSIGGKVIGGIGAGLSGIIRE
jgi:hypothetical protein